MANQNIFVTRFLAHTKPVLSVCCDTRVAKAVRTFVLMQSNVVVLILQIVPDTTVIDGRGLVTDIDTTVVAGRDLVS